MQKTKLVACTTLALLLAAPAWAQKPSAYPAKGQSASQQAADDGQCQAWAKQQTGIDPAAVAAAPTPTSGPQGERARGAVRGAALGAVVDDSHGAKVGATAGVLAGGARARRNQAAEAQSAQASKQSALTSYYRAWGACMQGRGYTVN